MIETWILNHKILAPVLALVLSFGFVEGVHRLVWWHRKHGSK
jgi:hypothetical protein